MDKKAEGKDECVVEEDRGNRDGQEGCGFKV